MMKNIHILLSLTFFFQQNINYFEVEARRGDVIPLGFESLERRHQGSQINQHGRRSYEYEKAEFPEFRKRKTKKKHKVIKNKNSLIENYGAEFREKLKHKGKKHGSKRFIKTTLKDSNLSDSEDNDKKIKPVDIIVHIKMKE